MSRELKRLMQLVKVERCWGDEPSPELLEQIEVEKRKNSPSKDLQDTLATLRTEWATAAVSQKRNRHVLFLGSVYKQVCTWRRLKRREELENELRRFYDVEENRDVFQALLLVTCGNQIDRKIRYRWACCLRALERHKTPWDLGAAQITRLGGINKSGNRK